MAGETEKKILDAALKLFAEKGYTGATTRVIAEEAGVSELTLFRKFKTKENLFDAIINQNLEKMKMDFASIFTDNKPESPRDFLETIIRNYIWVIEENFEVFFLVINDGAGKFDSAITEFFRQFTEYLEENITNSKVDYDAFVLALTGFTYMICIERYKGQNVHNYEKVVDKFINNSVLCV